MAPILRCAALVLPLLLTGCEAPSDDEPTLPELTIHGAPAVMDRLMPMLTETHDRTFSSIDFTLVESSSAEGIRSLLAGEADIAASSREHIPAEQEQALVDGYSFEAEGSRHIVAVDVIALTAHPSFPLEGLTYDQVIGIWCTGAIDNWAFLGLEDRPIRPLTLPPGSGSRALFEDFFCGPEGIQHSVEVADQDALHEALQDDPSAIGYTSMTDARGKVIGLRPDTAGPPVRPSQHSVIRGAYPLYHDLYLYTRGPADGTAASFLEWIESPAGQEVVDEARFVPLFLRPERLDEPRPLRETIHFEPGSSTPNQRSAARLQLLVDELRARAGEYRHVVLEGYTDDREPGRVALSRARAKTVQEQLDDELPGLFFEIIPRGATNPIAPNETPYGRQRNRRVQIYLAEEEEGGEIVVQDEG